MLLFQRSPFEKSWMHQICSQLARLVQLRKRELISLLFVFTPLIIFTNNYNITPFRKYPMPKIPGSENTRCRKYPVPKIPDAENTRFRKYPTPKKPGSENTRRRKYPVPKKAQSLSVLFRAICTENILQWILDENFLPFNIVDPNMSINLIIETS